MQDRPPAVHSADVDRPDVDRAAIAAPRAAGERSRPWFQFACLLGFAALIRCPAFGEWNYAIDDQYFALVGKRLLAGDRLYVDIWDRKTPLLYLVYAAAATLGNQTLAYQAFATVCAALGGYATARLARLFAPPGAALMAGLAYVTLLSRFGGDNGEAAVFYNPLMAAGALAVVTSLERLRQGFVPWRVTGGMLAAGTAVAFKQSAAFEACFLGAASAWMVLASRRPDGQTLARVAGLALAGATPLLAIAAWYWRSGHFAELRQAVVESNLLRIYPPPGERLRRIAALVGMIGLPLVLAMLGRRRGATDARPWAFVALWGGVALAAVLAYPNLYLHYALPLACPLAALCAPFFARPDIGRLGFAAMLAVNLWLCDTLALADRLKARPAAEALVSYVAQETPSRKLLVFGMPSYLYALLDAKPPSVLAFPPHLFDGAEAGATGHDEVKAMQRILASRPSTVVLQQPLPAAPVNLATVRQLHRYVRSCRRARTMQVYDHDGAVALRIYSRCG
ncbi:hypothetical protein [Novosphingobium soli]|uniref:Glycosyltransferase RgtA/B/C/D-like domain-containing protein n=1 Tax=Novosphingobium soli TaxID=574956 RepID=A0ABV6CSV1_9SPHN